MTRTPDLFPRSQREDRTGGDQPSRQANKAVRFPDSFFVLNVGTVSSQPFRVSVDGFFEEASSEEPWRGFYGCGVVLGRGAIALFGFLKLLCRHGMSFEVQTNIASPPSLHESACARSSGTLQRTLAANRPPTTRPILLTCVFPTRALGVSSNAIKTTSPCFVRQSAVKNLSIAPQQVNGRRSWPQFSFFFAKTWQLSGVAAFDFGFSPQPGVGVLGRSVAVQRDSCFSRSPWQGVRTGVGRRVRQ